MSITEERRPVKDPLYQIEGRPVYEGDWLHVHPSQFARCGDKLKAYRPDYGNGEAVMRSENGAVPTVRLEYLSWEPHPDALTMSELQAAGFMRPTFRDISVWRASRAALCQSEKTATVAAKES